MSKAINEATALLKEHYEKRLYNVQVKISKDKRECKELIKFNSPLLKKEIHLLFFLMKKRLNTL